VPVAPGGPLRLARARTPSGAPADGVVSGGRFIPLAAFASLDGVTIADLLPAWPRNLGVLLVARRSATHESMLHLRNGRAPCPLIGRGAMTLHWGIVFFGSTDTPTVAACGNRRNATAPADAP